MIALIGMTCSGKTTVRDKLQDMGMTPVVTYTTRPIRENEVDGIDYHFISEEEFLEKKKDGFFIETTSYEMVNGKVYYGTSKADVTENADNKVIILNPEGFTRFKTLEVDMVSFYLKCNENTLRGRLLSRKDDEKEIDRRLAADKSDFVRFDIDEAVDFVFSNDFGFLPSQTAYFISEIYENIQTYKFMRERV